MKYIYIWTNDENEKQYVGKTNNIRSRVFDHTRENGKGLLAEDIKKFGLSAFSLKVFPYPNCTGEELASKEGECIRSLDTLAPRGYNQRQPAPEREGNTAPKDKASKTDESDLKDIEQQLLSGRSGRSLNEDFNDGKVRKVQQRIKPELDKMKEDKEIRTLELLDAGKTLRYIADEVCRSVGYVRGVKKRYGRN